MTGFVWVDEAKLYKLSLDALTCNDFSEAQAEAITDNVVWAQAQECHSHGVYRVKDCVDAARLGGLDPKAEPVISDRASGVVQCDAQGGCSLLSFARASERLMERASEAGIAALAINNSYHFSALWAEVEKLSYRGYVGLSMTPSHAYTAPYGGKAPLLGTNPFAFSWPRPEGKVYTFDFATSMVARGELALHAKRGDSIPEGWAIDTDGNNTTNPQKALEGALLTFGGYKGSAVSTMIELLAGPLIGDNLGHETASVNTGDPNRGPRHGEIVIAMDPQVFLGEKVNDHVLRAEHIFEGIVDQGARLPSQRRHEAGTRNAGQGIPVQEEILAELKSLSSNYQ